MWGRVPARNREWPASSLPSREQLGREMSRRNSKSMWPVQTSGMDAMLWGLLFCWGGSELRSVSGQHRIHQYTANVYVCACVCVHMWGYAASPNALNLNFHLKWGSFNFNLKGEIWYKPRSGDRSFLMVIWHVSIFHQQAKCLWWKPWLLTLIREAGLKLHI